MRKFRIQFVVQVGDDDEPLDDDEMGKHIVEETRSVIEGEFPVAHHYKYTIDDEDKWHDW